MLGRRTALSAQRDEPERFEVTGTPLDVVRDDILAE